LKAETIGLTVMIELPMVIVNVQRGGPSTGLPTKTEQADLLQALYGRHGECPLAVIAPYSPTDCFDAAFEAVRIALKYMTPVIVLSDGFLANGSKPWAIPKFDTLPEIHSKFWQETLGFQPYLRDEDTLSRPWVIPGTPGLEHRIGGLEKDYHSGNISYVPQNHERMIRVRASKIECIVDDIAEPEVYGPADAETLVVGWGSTYGAIRGAVKQLNTEGLKVAHTQLRWLNPLPRGLEELLARYRTVIVPELNLGQLVRILRDKFLVDAVPISRVRGQPFAVGELAQSIKDLAVGGNSVKAEASK